MSRTHADRTLSLARTRSGMATLLVVLAGCAAAPVEDVASESDTATGSLGESTTPAEGNLIGDSNARGFNVGESGALTGVVSATWSRQWTHIVKTTTAAGDVVYFAYGRDTGKGKLFTLSASGGVTSEVNYHNLATDWDTVVTGPGGAAGVNLVFYRRSDGLLRGASATWTGLSGVFDQTIASPEPAGVGWDTLTSLKLSARGELFFYSRMAGRGTTLQYSATQGRFVSLESYSGLQKTWDEIEAGDLDSDGVDDLVLYNQESGVLKTIYMEASGAFREGGQEVLAHAGVSHGGRIVVADFGGGPRKDVLLYQPDGGDSFEDGRLRIWTDRITGSREVTRELSTNLGNVRDGWTHLIPVALGREKSGIVLYSNQHVVDLQVVPMASVVPGKRTCRPVGRGRYECTTEPDLSFTWKASDTTRLNDLARGLRKTFAPAGIAFRVTRASTLGINAALAEWFCGVSGDAERASANAWVDANIPATTIPLTLARESAGGAAGCAGLRAKFVKVSYTSSGLYEDGLPFGSDKHYAHEVGHYFGLAHSFISADTRAAVENKLDDSGCIGDLDTDEYDPGRAYSVRDTPPVLQKDYWTNTYGEGNEAAHMCADGTVETFQNGNGETVELTVNLPDVMSYGACAGPGNLVMAKLTRDQIRVVRQTLYNERKALIGL